MWCRSFVQPSVLFMVKLTIISALMHRTLRNKMYGQLGDAGCAFGLC